MTGGYDWIQQMYLSASLPAPAPIRRRRDRDHGAPKYFGWSPKMGRPVTFDTFHRFHYWLTLEGDPEVLQLCERYPEVRIGSYAHVFDMWVRRRDGREECIDVVPTWKFVPNGGGRRLPADWVMLAAWGRRNGYECNFITELDLIVSSVLIHNWRRMLPLVVFAAENPDEVLEADVVARVTEAREISLGNLQFAVRPRPTTPINAGVANLLYKGRLAADLDFDAFGPDLLLRVNRPRDSKTRAA